MFVLLVSICICWWVLGGGVWIVTGGVRKKGGKKVDFHEIEARAGLG